MVVGAVLSLVWVLIASLGAASACAFVFAVGRS